VSGLEVIDAISSLPTDDAGRPQQAVRITGCGALGGDEVLAGAPSLAL